MRNNETRRQNGHDMPGTVAGGNRKPGTLPQALDEAKPLRRSGTVATQSNVPGTGSSAPTRRSGGTVC